MRTMVLRSVCSLIVLVPLVGLPAEEREIDASDPTRIYTYLGGGVKHTDYTNGETMTELRVIGNVGLSDSDMILFEAGYGWHDGDLVPGPNDDWTNVRLRYFHLLAMDYDLVRGYRGMGLQFDMQLAGLLKGTDGQNLLAVGILPTYALGEEWTLYLFLNGLGAWDKRFEAFNGLGVSVGPKLTFSTERWWPGAQVNVYPEYRYFLTGTLEDEGSGILEINVGGEFTPTLMWDITGSWYFDVYLNSFRRGPDTGLEGDFDVFFNVTSYF